MRKRRGKKVRHRMLALIVCGVMLLGALTPPTANAQEDPVVPVAEDPGQQMNGQGEPLVPAAEDPAQQANGQGEPSIPAAEDPAQQTNGQGEPSIPAVEDPGQQMNGQGEPLVPAAEDPAQQTNAQGEPSAGDGTGQRMNEQELLQRLRNGGMTGAALAEEGIVVQTETHENISLDHFNFVSVNSTYDLNADMPGHLSGSGGKVPSGELAKQLPFVLVKGDVQVSYRGAYVASASGAKTPIYFVGTIKIQGKNYVYYVSDTELTTLTVYSVLREKEKIIVEYERTSSHEVDYQFWNENNEVIQQGPGGWTLDDVFGKDRVKWVSSGTHAVLNATVPRGYLVEIRTYHDENHDGQVDTSDQAKPIWMTTLGGMQKYVYSGSGDTPDQSPIVPTSDSIKTVYSATRSNDNITTDVIVVCKWKKIEHFQFTAEHWNRQVFANKRIVPLNENLQPLEDTVENYRIEVANAQEDQTIGNTFAWYFRGITKGNTTWEMDQLEINETAINVPTVSLASTKDPAALPSRTTTLPTGTTVTVTIVDWGGTNGKDARRDYKIEVTNCYEDITITGGNMVGHRHSEVAMDSLSGVADSQYYLQESDLGLWRGLHQNTLTARTVDYTYTNPFRYRRQSGYYGKAKVSLADKNDTLIQENGDFSAPQGYSGDQKAIEYLVLKSEQELKEQKLWDALQFGSTDAENYGGAPVNRKTKGFLRDTVDPFKTVTYEEWTESWDGNYYFRMTQALDQWMKQSDANGVVLLSVDGIPLPGAINYVDGSDEQEKTGPKSENIRNMPPFDLGGSYGYNCTTHSDLTLPARIPTDVTHQFVFSHWEVLAVDYDGTGFKTGTLSDRPYQLPDGTAARFEPSQGVKISSAFDGTLSDAFLWVGGPDLSRMAEQIVGGGRFVITLRAVWVDRSLVDAINYEVRFYIDGELVQSRRHAVPEGSTVVTDLYEDDETKETFSAGIQSVLDGDNFNGKKYTGKYVVREDTTMSIPNVTKDNYIANIYLTRVDMDVIVRKTWKNPPAHFNEDDKKIDVVLQEALVGDRDTEWKAYKTQGTDANGKFKLNVANGFTMTFPGLPRYRKQDDGTWDFTKPVRYRTLEIDPKNPDRRLGTGQIWTATCENSCMYIVSYEANYDENMNRVIDITNTYVGKNESVVVLGKTVSGTTDRDRYFDFKVTIKGDLKEPDQNGAVTYGDITFDVKETEVDALGGKTVTAEAIVPLKAGGAVFLRGLPGFTDVVIEELLSDEEKRVYDTTVAFDQGEIGGDAVFKQDATNPHRVTGEVPPIGLYDVTYHNYRAPANAVAVSKTVTGNMGDVHQQWQFEIALNEPYNQSFGGISFVPTNDGKGAVGYFSLKSGESRNISGLPDGIAYTIREFRGNMGGYTTTCSKTVQRIYQGGTLLDSPQPMPDLSYQDALYTTAGVTGVATLEYDDAIAFVNEKQMELDNGIDLDSLPYVVILVTVIGVAVCRLARKRKTR